jgi:menaquinone-9 beta-reductase
MRTVTVIGGGLSGLLLGIGLRKRGVAVRIFEAGSYPRHKVCGEFLSGRGRAVLDDLALSSPLGSSGAVEARDVTFSLGGQTTMVRRLPSPALCISRWAMDATLADLFQSLGGELFTGRREALLKGEGIVRATGRRPQTAEGGWRLFGLKAHAFDVDTRAGLEMHFTPRGYVGLCRVENGKTNVCGLFRSQAAVPEVARDWKSWLCGEPGSALFQRMEKARWDDTSFSSVAALALSPRSALISDEVSVGDAVTMIPPVTGNGMSMACESAALAIDPLAEWASGSSDWSSTQRWIAQRVDAAFSRRLRVAAVLQRAVVEPRLRNLLFRAIRLAPPLQDALFRLTR